MIGVGLINVSTIQECKAILAHEFGHFSQSSMKVGSYVYFVNHAIHNLLNDNEGYQALIQQWSRIHGVITFFTLIAVKIIQGIQWVLRKLYAIVNMNYMGLSREMEFNADEIAARVAGTEPLQNSLLRLSLAEYSFNRVANFYESKIQENKKSENLYREQSFVMVKVADLKRIPIENGLPIITKNQVYRFDKSKLVIKDQWASHPSIGERIERLQLLHLDPVNSQNNWPIRYFPILKLFSKK
jgi:Zn-dependent protease with chaperone function